MNIVEDFAKNFFANRIGGKAFGKSDKIYKFEKIKQAKRAAIKRHPDRIILDMGIGEPDVVADESVINTLFEEAKCFENRGYADNGCFELKEAISKYMQNMFKVKLDPDKEILHSVGSKAALSILPLCFVNPEDTVITTIPGYPIFGTHAQYLGANVLKLPLFRDSGFLPQFETLSQDILKKTKVVVLNYPNNPTGAISSGEFFKRIIDLAHKYSFLIVNDAAYSALTFDPGDRISIFEVDGAKEVALELHSMSKGFNMTGWRIGWVCGNEYLINAYAVAKNNTDSGQFLPIQKAAIKALENLEISQNNANRYSQRMDKVINIFDDRGLKILKPKAGFFIYFSIPRKAKIGNEIFDFETAEAFTEWMITKLGIVGVPWDDVDHAVRLSMTFTSNKLNEQQALDLLTERIKRVNFFF